VIIVLNRVLFFVGLFIMLVVHDVSCSPNIHISILS